MAIRTTGAVMLGALFLLAAGLAVTQFRASRTQAEIEAHRAAHVVATHYYWVLQASAQTLRRIEETGAANVSRSADIIRNIHHAVRELPDGYQYSVYDAAGRLRYSSVADATPITVADRSYFARLRNGEELVISPQITERLTGREVFVLARRLDSADGSFAGAATIAIPQSTLSDLARVLGLVEGSSIGLVANDGMLISRAPATEPMNLSGTPLFTALAERPDGTYEAPSPVDGTNRIIGYWQLDGWPAIAAVAISKSGAYSKLLRQWTVASILLVPAILFTALMLARLTQLMRVDEAREQQLVAAINRSNFLLREIHHRVKNNMQTVMSLIRLERVPPDVRNNLAARIEAMVKVHEEMYHSDQFERVDLRTYLTRLVRGIAESHAAKVELVFDLVPVQTSGDRAMQLGLLTNELISNAYKHAFRESGAGRLEVRLTEPEPGQLRLEVIDDGPGFPREPGLGQMGGRLVSAFATQLGGTVRAETKGGVRVIVDFPRDHVESVLRQD